MIADVSVVQDPHDTENITEERLQFKDQCNLIAIIKGVVQLDEPWVLQLLHDLNLELHVRAVGGCLNVHVFNGQLDATLLLPAQVDDAKLAPEIV